MWRWAEAFPLGFKGPELLLHELPGGGRLRATEVSICLQSHPTALFSQLAGPQLCPWLGHPISYHQKVTPRLLPFPTESAFPPARTVCGFTRKHLWVLCVDGFLSDTQPGIGNLWGITGVCLMLSETVTLFSKVDTPFCFATNGVRDFQLLHIIAT